MNRCAQYLAALDAEATFQLLAVGDRTVEVCRTHSYFDAAMEADELCEESEKLRLTFPGVKFLVVLDPRGKKCGQFDVKQEAKQMEKRVPPLVWPDEPLYKPAPVSGVITIWLLVAAATVAVVGWLGQ